MRSGTAQKIVTNRNIQNVAGGCGLLMCDEDDSDKLRRTFEMECAFDQCLLNYYFIEHLTLTLLQKNSMILGTKV